MTKFVCAILAGVGLVAVSLVLIKTRPAAAQTQQSAAVFDSEGKLQAPDPTVFREWIFVGAPLTPNALNDGKANFPEYHHVYVEKKNVDAYLKSGSFPEGTMIVKELTRVLDSTFPDGSIQAHWTATLLLVPTGGESWAYTNKPPRCCLLSVVTANHRPTRVANEGAQKFLPMSEKKRTGVWSRGD